MHQTLKEAGLTDVCDWRNSFNIPEWNIENRSGDRTAACWNIIGGYWPERILLQLVLSILLICYLVLFLKPPASSQTTPGALSNSRPSSPVRDVYEVSSHSETGWPTFKALWGKTRNRAFDGDLVFVVVAMFGMDKLIGRAPRKRRHRHIEPCRTWGVWLN